jgi:transposase
MIVSTQVLEQYVASLNFKDAYTPSGIRLTHVPKNASRMGAINYLTIQNLAVAKALEILGEKAWSYGYKSGKRCKEMRTVLAEVCIACKYKVLYRTFLRWFHHFLRFGETPAATRRRGGMKVLSGRRVSTFDERDNAELDKIICDKPYLYLDEIQKEMMNACNQKVWHTSTLWRQLRRRGYTLQKAVFRARQRSEEERLRFMSRLESNTMHPRQYIVIDEAHKSTNEARRNRAWSLKGVTPVLDAFFDRGLGKRYTLIAAADINGFVFDACEIIEREQSADDNDPNRGTVDAEKFEDYVEHTLVPNLGDYALDEPHSIVILDNATIHVSERVRQLIADAGA